MTSRDSANSDITPEVLLRAYACGIFPMAESADDPSLFWVEPEMRGVIPLDGFRIASRLGRTVRSDAFTVTVDTRLQGGHRRLRRAASRPQRYLDQSADTRPLCRATWAWTAHSVEVWQNDDLVGGLYGVNLGRAFFGESMFHRVRDASKVALVHLVARLIAGGFELLDTQYVTEHLRSFGAVEIPRRRYTALLDHALKGTPISARLPADQPPHGALRARNHRHARLMHHRVPDAVPAPVALLRKAGTHRRNKRSDQHRTAPRMRAAQRPRHINSTAGKSRTGRPIAAAVAAAAEAAVAGTAAAVAAAAAAGPAAPVSAPAFWARAVAAASADPTAR